MNFEYLPYNMTAEQSSNSHQIDHQPIPTTRYYTTHHTNKSKGDMTCTSKHNRTINSIT